MLSTRIGQADGPFRITECPSKNPLAGRFDRSDGSVGRFRRSRDVTVDIANELRRRFVEEDVAMEQKVDLQKSNNLFSRRVQFDLPKRMSQVYQLRERVRLAEMAATSKQSVSRPERPVDSRTK